MWYSVQQTQYTLKTTNEMTLEKALSDGITTSAKFDAAQEYIMVIKELLGPNNFNAILGEAHRMLSVAYCNNTDHKPASVVAAQKYFSTISTLSDSVESKSLPSEAHSNLTVAFLIVEDKLKEMVE